MRVPALVPAVVAVVAVTVVAAGAPSAASPARGATAACPRGMLPLGTNAIAASKAAVLRVVPRKEKPKIVSAVRATHDAARGRQAKFECGRAAWRRTVVVYFTRRAYLPAQSASQGVAFVGRFANGYRVWELVH